MIGGPQRGATVPVALAMLAGLAACAVGREDLPTKAHEKVKQQVEQHAEEVRAAVGADRFDHGSASVRPCRDQATDASDPDTAYYMQGTYYLRVPADQQSDALNKTRAQWQNSGYTIEAEQTFGPGQGGVIRAGTADHFELGLVSGRPPAMQLLIASPCYRNDSPG